MPEVTLLPCPACGYDAYLKEEFSSCKQAAYSVCCRKCELMTGLSRTKEHAVQRWNALLRALTWTRDPQLGAWNWWRDEYSCIPRYVYQDGTVAITMLIARVPYQDLGGQWAGPIPEPKEQGRHDE